VARNGAVGELALASGLRAQEFTYLLAVELPVLSVCRYHRWLVASLMHVHVCTLVPSNGRLCSESRHLPLWRATML
jgi:hypothetical protein